MNRFSFFFVWFCLLLSNNLLAQAPGAECVVQFQPDIDLSTWRATSRQSIGIAFKEIISERYNLALISYNTSQTSLREVRDYLSQDIVWISSNQSKVQPRTNDPEYTNQWSLHDIGIETFWEATTGGLSQKGDTITIAVMESGFSLNHPDLVDNYWHNYLETPDDGIDNDSNGYIDDYLGWNTTTLNDQHSYNKHGTNVVGIISAEPNNQMGIAGMNWNARLMPISFNQTSFATYFKAFEYLIQQRKLYNETSGEKGAFIVAVNESFGQDNAHPDDNPNFEQWCHYIEALGEVGILTVAATANSVINVDIQGDMPTTCPQDYLVAVTSIAINGASYGAYGPQSIDIAAPGSNIITTNGIDSYTHLSGTSIAAPHIAAAIGLIYSYPCPKWSDYVHTNPSEAALLAKEWLIETARPYSAGINKTVSEGSLNLAALKNAIDVYCGDNKLEPLALKIYPTLLDNQDRLIFEYDTPEFGEISILLFNMLGQPMTNPIKITSNKNDLQKGNIDISGLAPGMYFATLVQGTQTVVQRFVIY